MVRFRVCDIVLQLQVDRPLKYVTRTKEKLRSGEISPTGDQWPIFVYQGYMYDPEDPWNGLFRSSLLLKVSFLDPFC